MPAKVKITGTPAKIRKTTLNDKPVYCVDFIQGGKTVPPKGLPKPTQVKTTVLMNAKQWRKNLENEKPLPFLIIEGEVTLDVPMSVLNGDFAVIAFKVEKVDVNK